MSNELSNVYETYFVDCDETTFTCNSASAPHKHCNLCGKMFSTRYKCERHFTQAHASRAVVVEGQSCFPCRLQHNGKRAERAHYHCPHCDKTILFRNRFTKHIESHAKLQEAKQIPSSKGTTTESNESNAPNVESSEPNPTSFGQSESVTIDDQKSDEEVKAKRRKKEKKACQVCGKEMDPRSIQRHLKDIHGSELTRSVCVDEARGIFMVRKSSKGGVGYPVHVQKSIAIKPFCEDNRCRIYMEIAWRSGMNAVECRHLQQVGNGSEYKETVNLPETSLWDISADGPYKMLKRERIQECLSLLQAATSHNAELIVDFPDGERFIHFSVYDGDVHYYSRLGRVLVTCDLISGDLDCCCCRRKRGCVHKAICLWYLSAEGKLDNMGVKNTMATEDTEQKNDIPSDEMSHAAVDVGERVYPPTDENVVSQMCKYLLDHKRIPMQANRDKSKTLVNRLEPTENECTSCQSPLSRPILITNNATILTMDCVLAGVKTFYRKCETCAMCYRYQEFSDGLHNFNDSFILGLDVCIFLRESLQNHIPLGSMVQVLESTLRKKLNHQTVINAYLHYDALSAHEYNFYCSLCGFYPHVLTLDLNRKVAFQCPAEILRLPDDYDQSKEENDLVDSDKFWTNVELTMVGRGFPGIEVSEFKTKPDLLKWAPFIGKRTRASNLLMNTEHRKIRQEDGKLEQDSREVTEERLLEMLHQSTLREIRTFARQLGLAGTGSKLDIIMAIKKAVGMNDEKFKKAFGKLWGCSGGWASGTCHHGVVYALKFVLRSESPRDYVDLLLSMKFQPNITIVDVANLVAAHGNKRKENMFHPHNGKVTEATEENVTKGVNGELKVSFEWLETSNKQPNTDMDELRHPITGSNVHLSLFDRLHEKNVKKEEEVLRRVTHVKQLNGLINTQGQEQLNNVYNKDKHYLNSMKPVNHIFLFRSNIDFRNERINQKNLQDIQASTHHSLGTDEFGRVTIEKTKKLILQTTASRHPIHLSPADGNENVTTTCEDARTSTNSPSNSTSRSDHISSPPIVRPPSDPPSPTSSQLYNWPETDDSPESICSDDPTFGDFPSRPDIPCESNTIPDIFENAHSDSHPSNDFLHHDIPPEMSSLKRDAKQTTQAKSTTSNAPPLVEIDECLHDSSRTGNPAEAKATNSTTTILPNPYWIAELQLRMSDKEILEKGHWVTDRIIFAVFKILRKDSRTRNLAGLRDVVPATKYGFPNPEKFERFVQIINVRGNHWITLSNVKSRRDGVHIYDSYVNLSRKKNVISYPINVEECACQLTDPVGFVDMYVANVQQQRGGNLCGLYAITNATALCFGMDPMMLRLKQNSLDPVLKECLEKQDLTSFLSLVSKPKDLPVNHVLYEWVCRVHCHCKMPDYGELMVNCKKCTRWYHRDCEKGDFEHAAWMCTNCTRRHEFRKAELERKAKMFVAIRKASLKHPERKSLLRLYDLVNEIAINNELPPGDVCCGFVPFEVYKTITEDKRSEELGVTLSRDGHLFIVIFKEKHEDEIHIFETLVHEMVHAVQSQRKLKGTSHGKEFKKVGKEIIKNLNANMLAFPAPYCDVVLDEKVVLLTRNSS